MTVPHLGRCTGRATNLDVPQCSVETLAVPEPPREGPGMGEWVTEGRQRGQSGGTGVRTQTQAHTPRTCRQSRRAALASVGEEGAAVPGRLIALLWSVSSVPNSAIGHQAPSRLHPALPPAPSNAKGIFSRIIRHNATEKKTFGMSLPCDQAAGPRSTSSETVPAGCGGPVRPGTEGQTQHEVLCWPELCPASSLPKDSYVPGHTAGQQKQRRQEPRLKGPESLPSRRCTGRPVGGE